MTQPEGIGEQKEKRRRSRFWMMLGLFAVGGFIAGILSGLVTPDEGVRINPAFTLVFLAIMIVGFLGLSWYFFRSVDELELADNLWAGLFGIYFYIAVQPSWWLLHRADLAPPIDPWPIYFATCFLSFAVYLARKVINR